MTGRAIDDLLAELRELSADLFYPSEEDAPVEVVSLGVADAVEAAIAREEPNARPMSVESFFAAPRAGGFAAAFPENVEGWGAVHALLLAETTELGAYRVGEGVERRLVVGLHQSGRVIGLVTTVVAT